MVGRKGEIRRKIEMTILTAPSPAVRPTWAPPRYASWQEAVRDAIRDPAELCRVLDLPSDVADAARRACDANPSFSLFAPRGFVARMRPGDANDPLLRQVLPLSDELADVPGFVSDPVGDAAAQRQPGLLHKYAGRVLLVTTGVCAVHCRYCFRRHYPVFRRPAVDRRLATGAGRDRGRSVDPRGDPQRRRPADDRRPHARPARRRSSRRFRTSSGSASTLDCRS